MSEELMPTSAPAPSAPSVGLMLQAALDKGITGENVAVLEKLMQLYERNEAREAEKEFARAFVALQKEMPKVKAVKEVPDRDGNIKYHFAPYEEIDAQVRPFYLKHGFSFSFSMTFSDVRVSQECIMQHVGGHTRRNAFAVRVGKGPPGASEPQADGAASTYAKRFAFCNALNIVIEQDTDGFDARKEGAPITPDKVMYLRERIKETGTDLKLFLQYATAPSLEEIGEKRYDDCVRMLAKKDILRK